MSLPGEEPPSGKARMLGPWSLAFLVLAALMGCLEIEDPDIWWHLRTGQLIWQRGRVPRTDWFTYTNADSPWIDLHWGFQLFAAGLWAAGGPAALVLAKSALGAATFALVLAARRRQWPEWQSVACLLPSLLVYFGRNQVRPEIFSILFLAATLAVLFHARTHPWLVWFLPAIQVLWVNVQGLFVLGLVVWGCFVGDAALGRLWAWGIPRSQRGEAALRRWTAVSVLVVGAALASPYGYQGALFPLTLLARIQGPERDFYRQFAGEFSGLGEFIGEHGAGAVFTNLTTSMLLAIYVLGASSFFLLLARRQFSLYRALLFAAFGYLGWQASRNSVLFALVGGAVLHWNFGDLLEARGRGRVRRFHAGRVALASCLGLLLVAVPTDALTVVARSASSRRFGLGEAPHGFAHEAAQFLAREGMPRNVYAVDQGPAAVYIFHNGPERRVFADGRLEVHTRQTLERYLQIAGQLASHDPHVMASLTQGTVPGPEGKPEVPALLIQLDVQSLELVERLLADQRFRPVHLDDVAIVFLAGQEADRVRVPALRVDVLREALRRWRQASAAGD